MFSSLDSFVEKWMSKVFEFLNEIWASLNARAGSGAYFCFLLFASFILVLAIIGAVKLSKKFILFIILFVLCVVLPIVWFFVFK